MLLLVDLLRLPRRRRGCGWLETCQHRDFISNRVADHSDLVVLTTKQIVHARVSDQAASQDEDPLLPQKAHGHIDEPRIHF